MEAPLRALRPLRFCRRLRRVLFRDLFRSASARGPGGGKQAWADELRTAGGVLEPVEALELPGHALRVRRGRRGAAEKVSPLPDLPRLGDEPRHPARVDRG